MPDAGDPCTIRIPEDVLNDLAIRLERTRWPDERPGSDWSVGTPLTWMRDLVAYWQTGFDWRAQEDRINSFDHRRAAVDDVEMHFIHERAATTDALPILLLHGWPSTFWEFHKVIRLLAADAQATVVVPSLPGYGLSHRAFERGFGINDSAEILLKLMTSVLGHRRFVVAGGDWGAYIAARMAHLRPDAVIALHLNMLPLRRTPGWPPERDLEEQNYLRELDIWQNEEAGYSLLQATRPQTPSYALNDSPVGLAAWLLEKYGLWSDSDADPDRCFARDDLLTQVMLYWVTESIGASFWPYRTRHRGEWTVNDLDGTRLSVPLFYADFPKENIRPPRSVAERFFDVRSWVAMERGGHFPALEQPHALMESIKRCIAAVRHD